jgi:BASS family bile acid:Na+ symporter
LDQARADCRSHRLGDAGCAADPWRRVCPVRYGPSRTRPLFHAGTANFGAGPDVITGARRRAGLDVALTLASLIVSTAITPLTASFFTYIYLGTALASPVTFGLTLLAIIAGCALAATVIRRIAGDAFIEAQRERIDGMSMIAMSTFAIAAMDGVVDHFRADPLLVVGLTALAFALALGMIALTALVFLRAGPARAFAIGLIAGNRNIGLMLAATGFVVPDLAWLYFALVQFPIYLLPHLLKPLARRVSARR